MHNQTAKYVLIGIIACVAGMLIGISVLPYFIEQKETSQIPTASKIIESEISRTGSGAIVGTVLLNTKTIVWNNKIYVFIHTCDGKVKVGTLFGGEGEKIGFCLGRNTLTLLDSDEKVTLISDITETDINKVPVLIHVELLPKSPNGTALVSYSQESCTTNGDCGAGMPTNYATVAVDLNNGSYRNIRNYPERGTPVWNLMATKAIFIPQTCGGAGCLTAPIIGYNLKKDETNGRLTTEVAAGDDAQLSLGVSNYPSNQEVKQQYWKNLSWTTDSQFTAVIVDVDGKEKIVTGTF